MKNSIILFTVLILFITNLAYAEIPHTINYQGKATDASDKPLDGEYDLTFRIYTDETEGGQEDAIWTETHLNTDITKGVFSILLGSVDTENNPLNITFDKPYWISVEIQEPGAKTGNELPRQPITSVGYANAAETLTTSAIPSGVIVMWSGTIANIPEGWVICDGTNGTPDLTDRFILHADADADADSNDPDVINRVGDTGEGTIDIEHSHAWINRIGSASSVPSQVTIRYASNNNFYASSYNSSGDADSIAMEGDDDVPARTYYTSKTGSATQSIVPKFYALAFIMKE